MWQQWINLLLGLWVALSTYFGFSQGAMLANFTIVGIVIAILALWGALEHNSKVSRSGSYTTR